MYSFLPKFTWKISYRSIALQKNKLTFGQQQVQNTVMRILFLNTGMELHQDVFKKCLSLHSANIAEIALNITLCKTIAEEKTCPSQGQKYSPKQIPVPKVLKHHLVICLLERKKFYFICKVITICFPRSYDQYHHLILSQQHSFFSIVQVVRHILTQFSGYFLLIPLGEA